MRSAVLWVSPRVQNGFVAGAGAVAGVALQLLLRPVLMIVDDQGGAVAGVAGGIVTCSYSTYDL
jgi:hypothetical protein